GAGASAAHAGLAAAIARRAKVKRGVTAHSKVQIRGVDYTTARERAVADAWSRSGTRLNRIPHNGRVRRQRVQKPARFEDFSVPYRFLPILVLALFAPSLRTFAGDPPPSISADRIKSHIAYLASDRLEGRGPGTRGEELTIDYIASEFKKEGLKPLGQRGTYFQPVPLVRLVTSPKSTLRVVKGKDTIDFAPEEDFSGTSHTQTEEEEFDAEAIFVGHGIT